MGQLTLDEKPNITLRICSLHECPFLGEIIMIGKLTWLESHTLHFGYELFISSFHDKCAFHVNSQCLAG